MRLKIIILLFFTFFGLNLFSSNLSNINFTKANQLFADGEYQKALDIYLKVEQKSAHWKLFYNIGNCYYKLNNFLKAKVYYLKAEQLKPFESSVKKNIKIVNKKFRDEIPVKKIDFLSKLVLKVESLISLNIVSVVLLISIIILNLFIFFLIKRGKNKLFIYGISFFLIFTILISVYHIYRVGKQNIKNVAVIIKENSELRSGPGLNNTILFKVNPGIKVKIIDESRNWLQVSASSQIAGWIQAENLEQI